MKKPACLGVDIGSISTKGVVLDDDNKVIAEDYLWTEGNPIEAVKKLIRSLICQLPEAVDIGVAGTTGSARKLIGTMLGAGVKSF